MARRTVFIALLSVLGLTWLGCGGGGPKPTPVSGTVTHKGKPVPNANISFSPVEGTGRAATGITDTSGRYALGTFGTNDGALPGSYRVGIIARGPERAPKPGEVNSGMPGEMMPGDPIIPAKYFAPDTSGLTFDVKKGSNTADFQITD